MNTLQQLESCFSDLIENYKLENDEITLEVAPAQLHEVALILSEENDFQFEVLIDVCGVDYLSYGQAEWITNQATTSGFSRGVEQEPAVWQGARFAAVYHLLSISRNQRLRLRSFVDEETMSVDSVVDIWPAANWYERECYDLYGPTTCFLEYSE